MGLTLCFPFASGDDAGRFQAAALFLDCLWPDVLGERRFGRTRRTQLVGGRHLAACDVDGSVSIDNPIVLSNYVAYTACDEDTCQLGYIPENLRITLDDGDVILRNSDFQASAWPAANNPPEPFYTANYLAPGEPVIVAGGKEATGTVWAEIVYAGTHRAFVRRARQRLIIPVTLALFNLAGAVSVIVLSLRRWRTLTS